MPCFKPMQAYQKDKRPGAQKPRVYFRRPDGKSNPIKLPCGQCVGCRIDYAKEWAIRCMHEASQHNNNYFATLTYEHEPRGGTLDKTHFQKFMKKLRRARPGETIRYYMCGEYGDNLKRPHYHACLFNVDFPDKILWKIVNDHRLYVSEELNRIWNHGYCMIGDVTMESAAYVARYCMKKINGKKAELIDLNTGLKYYETMTDDGQIIQLHPEYAQMSLKNPIGKDWYKKFSIDCFPSDYLIHNGKKIPIPRYYDKILEKNDNETFEEIKKTRKEKGEKHKKNNTRLRLKTREKCLTAKTKLLKRNLEGEKTCE